MIIAAKFPFNNGERIENEFPNLVNEIHSIVTSIDAQNCKNKVSKEKAKKGKKLYNPKELNTGFTQHFTQNGWDTKIRVACDYSTDYYQEGYEPKTLRKGAFREIDFIKDRIGVEVQFGKYAFMVYNVCAKMTIFHNLNLIDMGIEIVPVKAFADEMSSGVSYFEQFVWDLEKRGQSDIDIPVMIYGIDTE